jgi:hypothetical protein
LSWRAVRFRKKVRSGRCEEDFGVVAGVRLYSTLISAALTGVEMKVTWKAMDARRTPEFGYTVIQNVTCKGSLVALPGFFNPHCRYINHER